tara:strand:- start:4246 stop:5076 length:831 start_codon:yes stop_codon:yes gene_type:complete
MDKTTDETNLIDLKKYNSNSIYNRIYDVDNLGSLDEYTNSGGTGSESTTISSFFIEEIKDKKAEFAKLITTDHLINRLTQTIDSKLGEELKTIGINGNVFKEINLDEIIKKSQPDTTEQTSKLVDAINTYISKSEDIDTRLDESLDKVVATFKYRDRNDGEYSEQHRMTAEQNSPAVRTTPLEGIQRVPPRGGEIVNALLINGKLNKTSDDLNPFVIGGIDTVENNALQMLKKPKGPNDSTSGGKGEKINFINKKTRRKKKDKKPKKITRRRLKQK